VYEELAIFLLNSSLISWQALVYSKMSGEVIDPNASLVASATKGVIFFGTPHGASTRASWSTSLFQMQKVPSPRPGQAKSAVPSIGGEDIIHINIKFTEMARRSKMLILSFYERRLTRTTAGKTLVSGGVITV
jgi:hypothetical protein